MLLATWNVNSIRARASLVHRWLVDNPCDTLLLQELKCTEDQFPKDVFEDLNYNLAILGQPRYNGVAVLSKSPIEIIRKGLPNFDEQNARYIECLIGNTVVASVYVPNGGEVGSDKYEYKLEFFKRLRDYLMDRLFEDERFIIAGDFNVALHDEDVFDPLAMEDQTCFTKKERVAFQSILDLGFLDALPLSASLPQFTWWDYRGGGLEKDHGMRLDYILLSPALLKKHEKTFVDKAPRFLEKASDHAPVLTMLQE